MGAYLVQALGSDLVLILLAAAGLVATLAAILSDTDARRADRVSTRSATPEPARSAPSGRSAEGAAT